MNQIGRRHFLKLQALAAISSAHGSSLTAPSMASGTHVVDASADGVPSDGKTLATPTLQRIIDRLSAAGGGTVYLTPGTYLTGTLQLRSRITLFLEAGATLLGSTNTHDYRLNEGMGATGDANGYHLLFARDAEHVTVCGQGVIDGQGRAFWKQSNRPRPRPEDAWKDVIAWDWVTATPSRPSPMLEFVGCTDLVLEGITIRNASGWTLRPVNCTRVHIRDVHIENPNFGPNTDGIDITNSQDVVVDGCIISTGDDAICLKSEQAYGVMPPTRNVMVSNCSLTTCCNGFKIGTATHGRLENIVFSNSVIHNGPQPMNERVIAGLGIDMVDGGGIDGLAVSNIIMQRTRTPIFLRLGRRTASQQTYMRNISIMGIQANDALLTSSITGLPDARIQDVLLSDIEIRTEGGQQRTLVEKPVPELPAQYPEARMFGRLPAFGLYARHVDGLRIHRAHFNASQPDGRPVVYCSDITRLELASVSGQGQLPGGHDILLDDVQDAFVHGCISSPAATSLLHTSGQRSRDIFTAGNAIRTGTTERTGL